MTTIPDFAKENIVALSWKAPYAQLMLHGKIETRTWPAKYRGWVLICCSKIPYSEADLCGIAGGGICYGGQFGRIMKLGFTIPNTEKDFGYAIAIGKLIDCRPMTKDDENECFVQYKEPWSVDKTKANGKKKIIQKRIWCHIYENVIPIMPFEFTGAQRWKRLTEEQKGLISPIS